MKLSVNPVLLKLFAVAGGVLGLLLQYVLYTTGVDGKGLLIAGHWAGAALTTLTVLVFSAVIILTRGIQGPDDYRNSHPASVIRGLGCIALTVALAATCRNAWSAETTLEMLTGVLTFASAAGLLYVGICRMAGVKPVFLGNAAACACFAIRMVSQYQHWSSDPQLMDYIFYLCAYGALMLAAYQQAAFDAGMGSHRNLWALSLAAAYLCCAALWGAADFWVLLAGAFWAVTNMTCLKAKARKHRHKGQKEHKPQEEV